MLIYCIIVGICFTEIPPSDLDSDSDELFEPIFPRKKTQASVTQVIIM